MAEGRLEPYLDWPGSHYGGRSMKGPVRKMDVCAVFDGDKSPVREEYDV